MPVIRPIYDNGNLIYTLTIFDAVIDSNTRKTLTQVLALLNITLNDDNDRLTALEQWKTYLTGTTADQIINTFKEVEDFLAGIDGSDSLADILTAMRVSIMSAVEEKGYLNENQVSSLITTALSGYATNAALALAEGRISTLEGMVPAAASAQNQLADKQFVNSSVSTNTATYRGAYNLVSDLSLTVTATQAQIAVALATKMTALSVTPENNDYCFVQIPTADATPTEIARVDRYKFNGTVWGFEFSLNNSGFTAAQWAALNSGITSGLVARLEEISQLVGDSVLVGVRMDADGNLIGQYRTLTNNNNN